MKHQAFPQADYNGRICTVCLGDRQQLPIPTHHNVCFGTRQQLSTHHYNVGAATSKQSRCATIQQLPRVCYIPGSNSGLVRLQCHRYRISGERKLKVDDNLVLICDAKQNNWGTTISCSLHMYNTEWTISAWREQLCTCIT